ncbi:hypothetical protein ACJ41O_014806 [Fusarium nematophilum]
MASLAGASTASSSSSSIDLGRTRRIIATRLGQSTEFQGQAIFVKDAPSYLYNDDEPTGAASLTGRSSARISDPDTDLRLDALFKIILDVFTRDIATDNSLHLATRIKTDYKCLPFVGVGASYIVRKLDDVPVGSRGSGSIASSRVGEKFLAADLLRVKEKQRVSKQLRAMRTTRNPERSRRLLDATMTELCILTHHPLKMHDNILDFLGVMWEYDEVWRVWPVLILEYADMGTLAKCLASSEKFTFLQKMRICLDIGNGLDALHTCAVSHGEPTTDLANIFEQAMKNGIEPEMSDILPAHFLAALQGQGNARVSESLSSLSALISRLPELAEHIRTANPQELDRSLALLSACQFGNSAAARLLLAHGARGGVTNDRGLGPLHFLSSINPAEQSSIARELVAAGANPNGYHSGLGARDIVIPGHTEISSVSGSPLHHAVLHNDLGAVKTLIECGSTPLMANSKGNEFLTPLALAAALHCPETLKMLLDASDIRDISKWCDHFGNNLVCAALDSQWNTLRMGIHCGDFYAKTKETLKMLWDLRADFEDISFGWMLPALHYACKMASVNVVALLLEMGLRHQINKTDSAIHLPLHQALETGNEHLVLLLLDQGADISIHGRDDSYCLHQAIKSGTATEDATDNTGLTMLGHLVQHEDQPMPALLSLLGPTHPFAPPGHLVGPDQLSALHLAAGAYKRPNPGSDATDVLEYLLLKFPNAEHLECAWGRWGLTPLMIAVITCNANAVKMLIEAGASVRTKASFGWSLASLVLRTLAIEALVRFRMAFLDTLGRYPDIGEPNLTFNNAVFSDITATIREYFLRPRPPPVRYPPGTSKASRSSRVQAFHELTRQQNLKISDISETRGGGDGRMYLKEADVDSNLGMLDVPNATLSELSLVLQEDLVRCPYIVHVSAYSWMRTEVRLPYRPVLLWQLFPNEVFVALSDHLHELRAMPFECGVYICSHVAAGLRAVHAAGFTHGRLDLDHVRIRNIIKKRASETILAGDKQPVTAQLWDFDYSSNVREDEAYHVYYQSERRTPFQAPELERRPAKSKVAERFETLKKYDAYALAILILCVLGGLDHERVLPRTGAYRDAAINAAVLRLVERSRPSKIGDAATVHLVPPLRKLLSEDPAGRPADVGEVAAALRTIQEVGNGKYILSA